MAEALRRAPVANKPPSPRVLAMIRRYEKNRPKPGCFLDDRAFTAPDKEHRERFILIGLSRRLRVLFVVSADEMRDGDGVIAQTARPCGQVDVVCVTPTFLDARGRDWDREI